MKIEKLKFLIICMLCFCSLEAIPTNAQSKTIVLESKKFSCVNDVITHQISYAREGVTVEIGCSKAKEFIGWQFDDVNQDGKIDLVLFRTFNGNMILFYRGLAWLDELNKVQPGSAKRDSPAPPYSEEIGIVVQPKRPSNGVQYIFVPASSGNNELFFKAGDALWLSELDTPMQDYTIQHFLFFILDVNFVEAKTALA